MNAVNDVAPSTGKRRWTFLALWAAFSVVCIGAVFVADRFPYGSFAFELLMRTPMVLPGVILTVFALLRRRQPDEPLLLRVCFMMVGVGIILVGMSDLPGSRIPNLALGGFGLMGTALGVGIYATRHLPHTSEPSRRRSNLVFALVGLIGGLEIVWNTISLFNDPAHQSSVNPVPGLLIGCALLLSAVARFVRDSLSRIITVLVMVCSIAAILVMIMNGPGGLTNR
jgi:hypothetical protein